MLSTFMVAACLIGGTVAVQAFFMSVGLRGFNWIEENPTTIGTRHPVVVMVIWILFLIIPIVIDVNLWASFYYLRSVLSSYEESLYFSTVTFTTVGYGDIVLDREWRLLATFEAINGWIIFGWATALIIAGIQRLHFRADKRWKTGGR